MTKVFRVLSTVTVVAILAAVTWAAPQATVTTSTPSATPSGAWFVSNYDTSRRRVIHRPSSIPEWCQCGGLGWSWVVLEDADFPRIVITKHDSAQHRGTNKGRLKLQWVPNLMVSQGVREGILRKGSSAVVRGVQTHTSKRRRSMSADVGIATRSNNEARRQVGGAGGVDQQSG
ncbi:hypothetical protein B0H13DRAFT_1880571 [Mycena leptocephala]|nr:hypothetical protein B0H13DRAFT_1880571 [Mycena leptocephala]